MCKFIPAPLLPALLVLLIGTSGHAEKQAYEITNLGAFTDDALYSMGLSINNAGQVSGFSGNGVGVYHAYRYDPHGHLPGLTDLGPSYGEGINDLGQEVITGDKVFRSSGNGENFIFTDLGISGIGSSFRDGIGGDGHWSINNGGQVTGSTGFGPPPASGPSHAFRSSRNGLPVFLTDLGTIGGSYSFGYGINSLGQVTGSSTVSGDLVSHAFRSSANGEPLGLTDLGTLGGDTSLGFAINDRGQVTGRANLPGGSINHAFRSSANGEKVFLEDLGTLQGYDLSTGFGINNQGTVVGRSCANNGVCHAFLYDGSMHDLNDFLPPGSGWELIKANGINESGQITGMGIIRGVERPFLLSH